MAFYVCVRGGRGWWRMRRGELCEGESEGKREDYGIIFLKP